MLLILLICFVTACISTFCTNTADCPTQAPFSTGLFCVRGQCVYDSFCGDANANISCLSNTSNVCSIASCGSSYCVVSTCTVLTYACDPLRGCFACNASSQCEPINEPCFQRVCIDKQCLKRSCDDIELACSTEGTCFNASAPTNAPTSKPTVAPTLSPTSAPTTPAPTATPTLSPTAAPTTPAPTLSPTSAPTATATLSPTVAPTAAPTTPAPTATSTPTLSPTFITTTFAPTTSIPLRPSRLMRPTEKPSSEPIIPSQNPPTIDTSEPTEGDIVGEPGNQPESLETDIFALVTSFTFIVIVLLLVCIVCCIGLWRREKRLASSV